MSASSIAAMQVGTIYEKVMDEVIMEMVQPVEDEGLDTTVLFDLRDLWIEKLRLRGGGNPSIPQTDGAGDDEADRGADPDRCSPVSAAGSASRRTAVPAAAASTAMAIAPIPQVDGGAGAAGPAVGINSNEALDSDDDGDSDSESDEDEDGNFMICQFDELKHAKHRYKAKLKNLVVEIDGTDHMFRSAVGDFTWGTHKAAAEAAAADPDEVGLATLLKSEEAEFDDDGTDFAGELASVVAASAVNLSKHPSGLVPVVVNVVASLDLGCPIGLRQLAMRAKNSEFKPSRFPAVTLRMLEPKATAQVFSTGKMKIKGTQSEAISHQAARRFARMIQQIGFPDVRFLSYKIDQVVGLCDAKFAVRLQMLYERCSAQADYDPERFPGLKYKMGVPKVTLTVFSTGKVMITGAKSREMIYDAFEKLYPDVEACKR